MTKRRSKYLPFMKAREVARNEQLPHRAAYYRWIKRFEPPKMPMYPHRIYEKVWTSWNDFLGNNNSFDNKIKQFRPYEETLLWAREQQIPGFEKWMVADLPCDIPRRPDLYYNQFVSWKTFLGTGKKKAQNVIAGAKAVESLDNILLIGTPCGKERGVISVTVHLGIGSCKDFLNKYNIHYVKAFYLEDQYDYKSVLELHGEYWGENQWMIHNINAMLFDINLRWV